MRDPPLAAIHGDAELNERLNGLQRQLVASRSKSPSAVKSFVICHSMRAGVRTPAIILRNEIVLRPNQSRSEDDNQSPRQSARLFPFISITKEAMEEANEGRCRAKLPMASATSTATPSKFFSSPCTSLGFSAALWSYHVEFQCLTLSFWNLRTNMAVTISALIANILLWTEAVISRRW
ncbi:hypothetical protein ARMGADRAFT_123990 [Armillaria gallica]|uniref:Uncharacterized protein n=1 Tax=Armillaria gallica TaxID=47427 RepID=A0A2H3DYK4_ARMGA|nr:hypothetical protein ARMGADRAFT_123990 [Armillaria gallica]